MMDVVSQYLVPKPTTQLQVTDEQINDSSNVRPVTASVIMQYVTKKQEITSNQHKSYLWSVENNSSRG